MAKMNYTVDRNRLKTNKEKQDNRIGKFRFLKKDTTTILRVLPFPSTTGENCDLSVAMVEHRTADTAAKNLGICMQEMYGEPCAICRANEIERENGGKALFSLRTRYVVNAYNVADPKAKMGLWTLPKTVHDVIVDYLLDPEYEDILDPQTGLAFSITSSGSGLDTEYTTKPSRKPVPVSKELLEQIVNPMDEIKRVSLDAQCEVAGLDKDDLWDAAQLEQLESGKYAKVTGKKTNKKAEPTGEEQTGDGFGFIDGDKVWCDDDGEGVEFTVSAVDGNTITIADKDDNEYEVPANSIHRIDKPVEKAKPAAKTPVGKPAAKPATKTKPKEEPEEVELSVGSFVTCPADGDNIIYEVKEIGDDEKTLTIENPDGDQFEVDIDDVELSETSF